MTGAGAPGDSERPLLFLDVDGVLNLWRPVGAVDRWTFSDGRLLLVPAGVAERLQRLAGIFDIVWATTWGVDAPEVYGRLLGLGNEWRVLEFHDRKWLSERQLPVDVIMVEPAAGVLARGGEAVRSSRGAVVVVDPGRGLDEAALDVLVEFATCRGRHGSRSADPLASKPAGGP